MQQLLIVETRDLAASGDAERMARLAAGMTDQSVPAAIFLTENAAFSAHRNSRDYLGAAISAGVTVLADRFALDERGIRPEDLRSDVAIADIDVVVDYLAAGASVMWS